MNSKISSDFTKSIISILIFFVVTQAFTADAFNPKKDIEVSLLPVENFESSKIFGQPLYHVCAGLPGILTMNIKGKMENINKLEIIMEMPQGFSIIGATPIHPTREEGQFKCYEPEKMSVKTIERNNTNYKRYVFEVSEKIVNPQSWRWKNRAGEYIYLKTIPEDKILSGTVYWRLRVNGKTDTLEKSFKIKKLPKLKTPEKQLDRFGVFQFQLKSQLAPFEEVRKPYLEMYKAIHKHPLTIWPGFNDSGNWALIKPESARKKIEGVFNVCTFFFSGAGSGTFHHWYMPKLKEDPSLAMEWLIGKDGKPFHSDGKPVRICPSYLAGKESQKIYWEKLLPEYINHFSADSPPAQMIVWDYEPMPKETCYCEKCRKAFMHYLKTEKVPTVEQINTTLYSKWFNFQVQLHAKIVKNCSKSIKKFFPATPFWICSDPLHTGRTKLTWCSLDPGNSDALVDGHMPMPYYSGIRCFDDIKLNVKEMIRPLYPIIAPTCNMKMFAIRYNPDKTLQNLLAAPANGCVGIGLYNGDDYDGLYLTKIMNGLRMLAKTEKYFFAEKDDNLITVKTVRIYEQKAKDEGREITIAFPDKNVLRYTVFQKGGKMLLNLFNYDTQNELIVNICIPSSKLNFNIYDVESGKRLIPDSGESFSPEQLKKGLLCSVPKSGVRMLTFIPENKQQPKATGEISQKEFRQTLKEIKEAFADMSFPKEQKSGKVVVGYGDIDKNQQPELRLESDGQKAYIDLLNGARVIGWKGASWLSDSFNYGIHSGFCDQLFLYSDYSCPLTRENFDFKIVSAEIIDEKPQAIFRYKIPPKENASMAKDPQEGLLIEKMICLEDRGKKLSFTWKFRNENPAKTEMSLAVRLKMMPCVGADIAHKEKKSLPDITEIELQTPSGSEIVKTGAPSNSLFLAQEHRKLPFLKGEAKSCIWKLSPVRITAVGQAGKKETLLLNPDSKNTAGCYIYWNNSYGYTTELLSSEFILKPGEEKTFHYSLSKTAD